MQDAPVGSWSAESPLSGEILASLRDLNQRFLDLAAARPCDAAAAPWRGLPVRIAALSSVQRAAAANCPYALFDLKFHDEAHWQMRLQHAAAGQVADAPVVDCAVAEFVQLALFYAWHVASTGALAAQLILGMNSRTAAAVGRATVGRIPALAAAEAAGLRARWSECDAFWDALVEAAARADTKGLRRVQLFGLQLAAAARLPRTSA
jgi:hypothetical protein